MRKYIGLFLVFFLNACMLNAAKLCHDFDESFNLITVNCQTGERIITAEEKARAEKQRLEAAAKAREARAKRLQEIEAKQQRLEKAIEKRKQELAKKQEKQRAKRQAEEAKRRAKMQHQPKRLTLNGKTYYLAEQPSITPQAGIQKGDWLLSLYGGAGAYISGTIHTPQASVEAKQVLMWNGGLSGLYFINPYFGLGLGMEMDQALDNGDNGEKHYGSWTGSGIVSSKISLQKIMLLGRINLNPAHAARAYVPFGIGYGYVKEKRKVEEYFSYPNYSYRNTSDTLTDSTIAYFVGMGLEFDLTAYVSLGIEGRYNMFRYEGEQYSYANGLLKINVKF